MYFHFICKGEWEGKREGRREKECEKVREREREGCYLQIPSPNASDNQGLTMLNGEWDAQLGSPTSATGFSMLSQHPLSSRVLTVSKLHQSWRTLARNSSLACEHSKWQLGG